MKIDFDAQKHEYSVDGKVYPSVTQVVRNVFGQGFICDDWYLERGRAVHHGCSLLDKRTLDWESVDNVIRRRIEAYAQFRLDVPGEIVLNEEPMCSEAAGFAGTPDRVIDHAGSLVLVDIKSNLDNRGLVQLGGYSRLFLNTHRKNVNKACLVKLDDKGKYFIRWVNWSELLTLQYVFMSALSVYKFKKSKGIK